MAAALPPGIKMFSAYVIAHMAYLKGEYGRALGICEAAFMFRDGTYPISMIYLYCMMAMCQMNLKHQQKAKDACAGMEYGRKKTNSWNPLLNIRFAAGTSGVMVFRKEDSKLYNKLSDKVISFSRGWMAIHNPMFREFDNRCIIHGRILDCHAGKP